LGPIFGNLKNMGKKADPKKNWGVKGNLWGEKIPNIRGPQEKRAQPLGEKNPPPPSLGKLPAAPFL